MSCAEYWMCICVYVCFLFPPRTRKKVSNRGLIVLHAQPHTGCGSGGQVCLNKQCFGEMCGEMREFVVNITFVHCSLLWNVCKHSKVFLRL